MPGPLPRLAAAAALALLGAATAEAAPKVVASIKPIHSLVAAVMEGTGAPALIIDGAGSPHTYAMNPSDASALQSADVIFWAGDGFEAFLAKPIRTLGSATSVALIDAPGLERLPFRAGGAFEADSDEGAEAAGADGTVAGGEGGYDMHFWLDPVNARAMTAEIARALAAADGENAAAYRANAARLDAKLGALLVKTEAELASVKGRPFIVFHDAYQYYERRFGVIAAGSITVSPETPPGVQRVSQIQEKVRALGAACVFAEPQFEPTLVRVVTEGTDARVGVLDPEGADLAPGPALYFALIDGLTAALTDCLGRTG